MKILIFAFALFAFANLTLPSAFAKAAEKVAEAPVVLDVRTPAEYAESHVKGAFNIDIQDPSFSEKLAKLDRSKEYKVYCRSGNRSGKAIEKMRAMGFKKAENLITAAKTAKALGLPCEGQPCN